MSLISDDWPPFNSAGKQYTKLALIKSEKYTPKPTKSIEHDYLRGDIDSIMGERENITLNQVFYPIIDKATNSSRLTILMDGAPGVGKTTVARKLCIDWANGELLQEYHLVIYIPLREVEGDSLASLLPSPLANEVAGYLAQLCISGKYTLFIFDGFDELSSEDRSKKSLFMKIIKGQYLHHCSVLIISRPYASSPLKSLSRVNRHIEVLGFSETQIVKYIKQNLPTSQAQKLIRMLKERLDIVSLCYIPLNCKIVLFVFDQQQYELPATLTELYEIFVLHTIKRSLKKQQFFPEGDEYNFDYIEELPASILILLDSLCEIAFKCMEKDKLFLEHRDLQNSSDILSLGLLSSLQCISSRGLQQHYQFLHLTIQEFLAARYLSSAKLAPKDRIEFFRSHINEERFRMTLLFLAGLTNLDFVPPGEHLLVDECIDLSPCQTGNLNQQKFFLLIHLIYESGKNSTQGLINLSSNTIVASKFNLSPFNALVLTHFLSSTSKDHVWDAIKLIDCDLPPDSVLYSKFHSEQPELISLGMTKTLHVGQISTSILAPIIAQTVREVMFSCTSISHNDLQEICMAIEKAQNLQVIKISLLKDTKKIIFSKQNITIPFEGTEDVSMCSNSLNRLLRFINTQVFEFIDIGGNKMAFQDCTKCDTLGSETVTSLSKTLEVSTNIRLVNLSHCNLAQENIEELAVAVTSSNKTSLKSFNVDNNPFTVLVSLPNLLLSGTVLTACSLCLEPNGKCLSIGRHSHSYQSQMDALETLIIPKSFVEVTFKINLKMQYIISILENTPHLNKVSFDNNYSYRYYSISYCADVVALVTALTNHKHLQSFSGVGIRITKSSIHVEFSYDDLHDLCARSMGKLLAFISPDEIEYVNLVMCSLAFRKCTYCKYSHTMSVIELCNVLKRSKALKQINLRSCNINEQSMEMIISSLEQSCTTQLEELILSGNKLTPSSFLKLLSLQISKKVRRIEVYKFSINYLEDNHYLNLEGSDSAQLFDLIKCLQLPSRYDHLSVVSLDTRHYGGTYIAFEELSGLLLANPHLTETFLPKIYSHKKVDCQQCVLFAEALFSHKCLQTFVLVSLKSQTIIISKDILRLGRLNFCPQALQHLLRFMVPNEVGVIDLSCDTNLFKECASCGAVGELALSSLVELLQQCENIKLLDITGASFSEGMLNTVVDALSAKSQLEMLFLSENKLSAELFRSILDMMLSYNLYYLNISCLTFKMLKTGSQIDLLVHADRQSPHQRFYFSTLFEYLAKKNQVTKLVIDSQVKLPDEVIKDFSFLLNQREGSLDILDLSSCLLSGSFLRSLTNCVTNLTMLHLHSVGLTGPTAILLLKKLATNEVMKALDISSNDITHSCSFKKLGGTMQELLEKNKCLEVLNISKCGIDFTVVQYIEAGMLHNTSLKEIDLSCHDFTGMKESESFAKSIEVILTKNYTLQNLAISFCKFSDVVVYRIANALKFNTTLKELHLSCLGNSLVLTEPAFAATTSIYQLYPVEIQQSCISQSAWMALFIALKENSSLQTIAVCFNMFTKPAMDILRDSLHHNKSITKVLIFGCNLPEDQWKELADELPSPEGMISTVPEQYTNSLV